MKVVGWIPSVNFTRNRTVTAGGANASHQCALTIKAADRLYKCYRTFKKAAYDAEIYPDAKHSDHCPVYLDIRFEVITGESFQYFTSWAIKTGICTPNHAQMDGTVLLIILFPVVFLFLLLTILRP